MPSAGQFGGGGRSPGTSTMLLFSAGSNQ